GCPAGRTLWWRACRKHRKKDYRRTTMTALPDRNTFESAYPGQAPWDIGRPNKVLVDVADPIAGSVLDAGCGTREKPPPSPAGPKTSRPFLPGPTPPAAPLPPAAAGAACPG